MQRHTRITAPVALAWLVTSASGISAQTSATKPSTPSVVAPPTWSRVVQMPDGRTFVTDGGLSIDVIVAKPATLPSTTIPPETAKVLAAYFTAPFTTEVGLRDLQAGDFANTFKTADGISLNGNYVNFLRRVLPGSARLRVKGGTDPVVVMADGRPVAILMPVATPTR